MTRFHRYGMPPMSRVKAGRGEWKRRTGYCPHPGDCMPENSIKMSGMGEFAVVYVCRNCEKAKREMSHD